MKYIYKSEICPSCRRNTFNGEYCSACDYTLFKLAK